MASITCPSDQRLSTSKRRLKPLMLRDYLLDDLSSCSSNGFKSFPRTSSSSTVRRLLDAEIKRSGLIHKPRLTKRRRNRTTCGTAITHAVHKASTAFLNAVKLLPFKVDNNNDTKPSVFSRSFSKRLSFWRKPLSDHSRRDITVVDVDEGEIQWWRSAAFFSDEDQPSDLFSQISTTEVTTLSVSTPVGDEAAFSVSPAAIMTVEFIPGDSSSSGSEFFTNSEAVQSSASSFSSSSSSGESEEASNENDAVEDGEESLVMSHDCEESCNSLCNSKDCVNEEKEQLSPVSILDCPFDDDDDVNDSSDEEDEDDVTLPISHQNDTYENIARKSRRLNALVRLEPLELEKRIEKYEERQEHSYHTLENEAENRANRLFDLVKSRIGETNNILASKVADNLLLDYLQEDNIGAKEETLMVKKVEDWVMGRQEETFMSWQVREKREVYVKEMQWGCITGDERKSVVEDLANGFITSLVDEFIFDLAS